MHRNPRIFRKLPDAGDGVRHLLVVTIDTEEEGRWGGAFPREGNTCHNIEWLRELDPFEREYGIKPTYLVDYPVATDPRAVDILRERVAGGRGEIGAHLHPWCNPPYEEVDRTCVYAGHLPARLLEAKLRMIRDTLAGAYGTPPSSYRAGRWGFSASTLAALETLGFHVDSSVIPLRWEKHAGLDDAPSYLRAMPFPYFPDRENPLLPGESGVLEIPVPSVIVGPGGGLVESVARRLVPFPGFSRLLAAMGRSWIRPSTGTPGELRRVTRTCMERRHPVLNVVFHSSELMPGASPYVKDKAGLRSFLDRFRIILDTAMSNGDVLPVTLSEARDRFINSGHDPGTV